MPSVFKVLLYRVRLVVTHHTLPRSFLIQMVATGALSSKSCDCYHGTPHPSCGCPLPGSKGCDCDCPTGTPPVTCGCGTPRSVILLASAKKDAATGNGLRGYT